MIGEQDINIDNIDNIGNIGNIDIVIVMDCTGSMQNWIDAAKDTVLDAFSDIHKEYPKSSIRLGLVCYRDIGDEERFIISPLTENIQAIQDVLKNVKASGGNDESEDVAGALEKTIELFREGFSKDYNPVRNILFVTDAPAHGLKYHPITVGDRFPNGDPDGKDPYSQIRELAFMGVDLTIFRVKSIINTMVEEFHKAFIGTQSTFTVLDVAKQDLSSSSSSSSHLSSPLSCLSLMSGFIDLSTYDDSDDIDHRAPSTEPYTDYRFVKPSETSETSERTFRNATCESIISSIQRRCI